MGVCPKCHCGYLVEIGRKMHCMNCDYSCSRAVAALHKDTKHIHKKVSYANEIKYTSNNEAKPVFQNIKYAPSKDKTPMDYRTRKNSKPLAFLPAAIIIFWIVVAFISFISGFIETFFF